MENNEQIVENSNMMDELFITLKSLLLSLGVDEEEVNQCNNIDELQFIADKLQNSLTEPDPLENISIEELDKILNSEEVLGSVDEEELRQVDKKIEEIMRYTEVSEIFSGEPSDLFKIENIAKLELVTSQIKEQINSEKDKFEKEIRKAQVPNNLRIRMYQEMNKSLKPLLNDLKMFETLITELKSTRETIIEALKKQYPQNEDIS